MYNKTIITFGVCDIRNSQGLAPAFGSADNTYLDLDYSGYHKNLIQWLFIVNLNLSLLGFKFIDVKIFGLFFLEKKVFSGK